MNKAKRYSFLVLRIGISLVFLWFGFSQIKNPSGWIGMIPSYAKFIPENLLIYSNGIIEIILSVLSVEPSLTRIISQCFADSKLRSFSTMLAIPTSSL